MYKVLLRPLLFRLSADSAHEITIKAARALSKKTRLLEIPGKLYTWSAPSLKQNIWGLDFSNPVGLAAGFDKNGASLPFLEKLGFGFIEMGSVTACPSTGNPKPRSFRLPRDESIINRLGLNNDGAQTIAKRIKGLSFGIPLGINIAKTHDPSIIGQKALEDYKASFDLMKEFADYMTLNISCPNTREGKTFEDPHALNTLLDMLGLDKDSGLPPVLVKFSTDLSDSLLSELIAVCEAHAISGYVATNTSSQRDHLTTSSEKVARIGAGGLSGRAITHKSTAIIEKIHAQTNGKRVIIGVGGIHSGQDAIDKLKAGADLLQVYTGLIYHGPSLVKRINKKIAAYLENRGLEHIYQIRS